MSKPIYLDYMATTPIDPRVVKRMLCFMGQEGAFGNPSSATHVYGLDAAVAVEKARKQVADAVGALVDELIFTSGATEANNLALFGAARFYQHKGRHLITLKTEHKAVLDCMQQLEREGFEVTRLAPKKDGLLDLNEIKNALREDTILVSIMHVNNEIGVVQDIKAIGELLQGLGILFHVDAAQSAGKLPLDLKTLPVQLMSFSAHKLYGPKGIGALFIRHKPRVRLQPILFGGGQERGMRAGTLATHQIVGMGEAFGLANACMQEEQARILKLRNRLWEGICSLEGITLNGHPHQRVAGNLNISFQGISPLELLPSMPELAISTTSACMSAFLEPSYVLEAIGVPRERALSSVRISLGRFTTEAEIDTAITVIQQRMKGKK